MKYKYDPETDILVIHLSDEKPDFGEQEGNVITHYNRDNRPVEIEILDASKSTIDMVKEILTRGKAKGNYALQLRKLVA